jgi:DNA-binding NarL/FixJ family response regulator
LVNPAKSGADGIDRLLVLPPDIALIKANLVDISGEIVIGKIKHMVKTKEVKCIVYSDLVGDKGEVADVIARKEGVDAYVKYYGPGDIVEKAIDLLERINKKGTMVLYEY